MILGKFKIRYVITGSMILSVILTVSVIAFISISNTGTLVNTVADQDIETKLKADINSAKVYIEKFYGSLSLKDGSLVDSNEVRIDGNFEMVDRILADLGDAATIFAKKDNDFVRVVTNIKDNSGNRVVGTLLGKDSAAYGPVSSGNLFIGEAQIIGVNYSTAYYPLIDEEKEVFGIIFLGVPRSDIENLVSSYLSSTIKTIALIAFIITIVMSLFSLYIALNLSRPLEAAVLHAERMADLDLSKDSSEEFLRREDELGALAKSFQSLSNILRETVVGIIKSSQQVATATEQIGQDNENLSQRTSEQASSLEEIAATIEESNATTKQNSDNAIEASKLTQNTLVLAENGGVVVEEAVKSIGEINASSARIADIISMINEIAFQTNLLALNAAVEAARAGDQGRGFAVVAGEVRNLAQRSGEAAKEIGVLIKDSVDKIGNGTDLVNKSGEALREIIQAVKQVNNIVSEMAAASDEQRRGIEQINTAVTEMDNMTQQNAALVEETASASEEMSSQAQELLSMVQRFNVGSALESITEYSKSGENRRAGITGRSSSAADGRKLKTAPVQTDIKKGLLDDGGYEEF